MQSLKAIYVIWLREFKTFIRERSRIIGMIGQPLLFLGILGTGITNGMSLNGAPPGMDYIKFLFPGIIAMSVLFTSIFSAVSIIWDREFGFLKEVLVAPVPRWAIAVGKILGGSTTAMIQAAIMISLAPFLGLGLSVTLVLKLLLVTFMMSLAVTSFGVLIAARMKSMQGFQMIMNFLIMPMFFLSGGMFPLETAPAWMKTLMVVDPLTYGVDALRNVIFADTILNFQGIEVSLLEAARQANLVQWSLSLDAAVLLGVAVVLSAAATYLFNITE